MRARDLLDLVALGFLWGASFLFMRIAGPDFGAFALVEVRVAIAALVLLPLLPAKGPFGELASFIFLLFAASGAAALLYRHAPNNPSPTWSAIWPGAVLFASTWFLATAAFAYYAANFGSYNATYGSLGAVIVLITWFYASGFFLLLGAELAAVRNGRLRPSANKDVPDSQ